MQFDGVIERTGGRNARVREAVLDALRSLLEEKPTEEVTTSEVARRSGVNRSTIHRRWGGLSGLLADLAVSVLNDASPLPADLGDLREELMSWTSTVIVSLNDHSPGRSPFLSAMLRAAADGNDITPYLGGRLDVLEQMLDRARGRGEKVALSAYDLAEIVLFPLYAARLLSNDAVRADAASRLVDRFLRLNEIH